MYRYCGIDLAVKRKSSICFFDGCGFICRDVYNQEIPQLLRETGCNIVTLDAPLSMPEKGFFRDCEKTFIGKGALPIARGMVDLAKEAMKLREELESFGVTVLESIAPVIRRKISARSLGYIGNLSSKDQEDAFLMAFISYLYDWDAVDVFNGQNCAIYMPASWVYEEIKRQLDALKKVKLDGSKSNIDTFLAVDVSYKGGKAKVGIVLSRGQKIIDEITISYPLPKADYVPGFLSAREADLVEKAIADAGLSYDLVVLNGTGLLHFRAGLSTVVGVELNKPSVGVTRKPFCRDYLEMHDNVIFWRNNPVGIFDTNSSRYLTIGNKIDIPFLRRNSKSLVNLISEADKMSRK